MVLSSGKDEKRILLKINLDSKSEIRKKNIIFWKNLNQKSYDE